MIEFFEFLNTCSAARAVTYLLFTLVMTIVIILGIGSIVTTLMGKKSTPVKKETNSKQVLNG
jgi:hypothetical protein